MRALRFELKGDAIDISRDKCFTDGLTSGIPDVKLLLHWPSEL